MCDGARRGNGCTALRWRYDDFEAVFLAFVAELDLSSVFSDSEQSRKRKELDDQLDRLEGELSARIEERDKVYSLLLRGQLTDQFAEGKFNELGTEIKNLEVHLTKIHEQKREEGATNLLLANNPGHPRPDRYNSEHCYLSRSSIGRHAIATLNLQDQR